MNAPFPYHTTSHVLTYEPNPNLCNLKEGWFTMHSDPA